MVASRCVWASWTNQCYKSMWCGANEKWCKNVVQSSFVCSHVYIHRLSAIHEVLLQSSSISNLPAKSPSAWFRNKLLASGVFSYTVGWPISVLQLLWMSCFEPFSPAQRRECSRSVLSKMFWAVSFSQSSSKNPFMWLFLESKRLVIIRLLRGNRLCH